MRFLALLSACVLVACASRYDDFKPRGGDVQDREPGPGDVALPGEAGGEAQPGEVTVPADTGGDLLADARAWDASPDPAVQPDGVVDGSVEETAEDAGPTCGDGTCNGTETCHTCADCACKGQTLCVQAVCEQCTDLCKWSGFHCGEWEGCDCGGCGPDCACEEHKCVCGPACGDGDCAAGEDCSNCWSDCSCNELFGCAAGDCIPCPDVCLAVGLECGEGPDGCQCDPCQGGLQCYSGKCKECHDGNDDPLDGCDSATGKISGWRVNDGTEGEQSAPAVASLKGSEFLVVWESGCGGCPKGLRVQKFSMEGSGFSGELVVPGGSGKKQENPAVAAVPGEDGVKSQAVVAWQEAVAGSKSYDIRALVLTYSVDTLPESALHPFLKMVPSRLAPAVAGYEGGCFVVVSGSDPAGGAGQECEIYWSRPQCKDAEKLDVPVNTVTNGEQRRPAVAVTEAGSGIVVWDSVDAGQQQDIAARYLLADGQPLPALPSSFTVAGDVLAQEGVPSAAILNDGTSFIVWQTSSGELGSSVIGGRVLKGWSSQAIATVSGLSESSQGSHSAPVVAATPGGGFVVAWQSCPMMGKGGDGDGCGIYCRRFSGSFMPESDDIQVNTVTEGEQTAPSLAVFEDGSFIVVWQEQSAGTQGTDIMAQRFNASGQKVYQSFTAPGSGGG